MQFKKILIVFIIMVFAEALWASAGAIPVSTVISQIVNLSILVGALVFTQRKTVAAAFKAKREEFLKSVNEASESKKAAETALSEVKKRVDEISETFDTQIKEARKNAEETYRDELAQAKNEALNLQSSSKTNLEFEVQRQIEKLRVEAFQKSATLAEKNLEKTLTPDQRKSWNTHFIAGKKGAH